MKLKMCISGLLFIVCLLHGQDLSDGAFAEMVAARVQKGLPLVVHSQALSNVAKMYAVDMAVKQEVNHSIMTWDERFELIRLEINHYEETWLTGRGDITIRECLAFLPVNFNYRSFTSLTRFMAHCFDDSPPHAGAVYHEHAVVAGWGVIVERDGYWICLYVATGKE